MAEVHEGEALFLPPFWFAVTETLGGVSSVRAFKAEERLAKAHGEEKDELQSQLNEERLSRMEKEVERNDAIEAKENAIRRCTAVENKLREMHELITEAKVLTGVNERLHKALQAEAERRKILHNRLEDLKGRIRVYVRIRPLSSTEMDRQCQTILTKEDKRTCVMAIDPNKAGGSATTSSRRRTSGSRCCRTRPRRCASGGRTRTRCSPSAWIVPSSPSRRSSRSCTSSKPRAKSSWSRARPRAPRRMRSLQP